MTEVLNKYTLLFKSDLTEIRYRLFAYPRIVTRYRAILIVGFVFNLLFVVRNQIIEFNPANTYVRVYFILPLFLLCVIYLSWLKTKDPSSYLKFFQSFVVFTILLTIAFHTWIVVDDPMESGKNIAYTLLILLPAFTLLSGMFIRGTIVIILFYLSLYGYVMFSYLGYPYGDIRIEETSIIVVVVVVIVAKYFEEKGYRQLFMSNQKLIEQNAEVATAVNKLTKSNEFHKTLIGYLAHDIRGPMNNLKGIIHLFNKSLSADEFKGVFKNLEKEFGNTDTMLNNMLYWIRSQTDDFELNLKEVGIEELIMPSVKLYEKPVLDKGIVLEIDLDKTQDKVVADVYAMEAVVRNILSNAIKHCADGDKIKISSRPLNDNLLTVFIQDTGAGMDNETIRRVTINHKTTEIKKDSFGIGLQICKEVLSKHGAGMNIASELGKGTVVSFDLKMA